MKKIVLAFGVLLASTSATYAASVDEQLCKSAYKDIFELMSYVVPCEDDMEDPKILQGGYFENISDRLEDCEDLLSEERANVLEKQAEEEFKKTFIPKFQVQTKEDLPNYCKSRKAEIKKILETRYRN